MKSKVKAKYITKGAHLALNVGNWPEKMHTKEWAKHVKAAHSSESLSILIKWRKRETRLDVTNGQLHLQWFSQVEQDGDGLAEAKREEAAHNCHLEILLVLKTSPWAIGARMDGRNIDRAKVVEETMQSQEKDSSFSNSRISGGSRNKNTAVCPQIYLYSVCFQKWTRNGHLVKAFFSPSFTPKYLPNFINFL